MHTSWNGKLYGKKLEAIKIEYGERLIENERVGTLISILNVFKRNEKT